MSLLKEKSLGFLLGRLLVLAHKVIQQSNNEELVNEAKELLQRYENEKRVKNRSDKSSIDIYKISKN